MNKQEAIKELAYTKIKLKKANVFVSPSMDIAINMAIEALELWDTTCDFLESSEPMPSAEPVTSGYIADDKGIPDYKTTTAVSEPVHGEWVQISPAEIYECSKCGQNVITYDIEAYKFCHGCGAKMKGGEDE